MEQKAPPASSSRPAAAGGVGAAAAKAKKRAAEHVAVAAGTCTLDRKDAPVEQQPKCPPDPTAEKAAEGGIGVAVSAADAPAEAKAWEGAPPKREKKKRVAKANREAAGTAHQGAQLRIRTEAVGAIPPAGEGEGGGGQGDCSAWWIGQSTEGGRKVPPGHAGAARAVGSRRVQRSR